MVNVANTRRSKVHIFDQLHQQREVLRFGLFNPNALTTLERSTFIFVLLKLCIDTPQKIFGKTLAMIIFALTELGLQS